MKKHYSSSLYRNVANEATGRYNRILDEVERVKNGIYHNKKGHIQLTEISHDPYRMAKRMARASGDPDKALERVNGVANFQDISIVKKVLRQANSVCRITLRNAYGTSGFGTGFLVSPRLLLTNNHVLPNPELARNAEAQFNYELDENGNLLNPSPFRLRPEKFFLTSSYQRQEGVPYSGLDFTLVAIEEVSRNEDRLERYGYTRLDGELGKIIDGENCVIIQHPQGDYKKIILKDIRMITISDDFLVYESDTLPGSSGSMVLGLGTGEAIALHHSGVPRTDAQGNWLRKDGTPAQPDDSDEDIDWVGNEGVRVSRIVNAIQQMEVPEAMQELKQQVLELGRKASVPLKVEPAATPKSNKMEEEQIFSPVAPVPAREQAEQLQQFEVLLAEAEYLQEDWQLKAEKLVEGLEEAEPLLPGTLDPVIRRMQYISVRSAENPWKLAARIEQLPHVESCLPDLAVATDVSPDFNTSSSTTKGKFESGVFPDDGGKKWDESDFLRDWRQSVWFKAAINSNGYPQNYYRWWNWLAVNSPQATKRKDEITDWGEIKSNLRSMKLTQLDTGYSRHTKVLSGYDLHLDRDFVDGDLDAMDEMDRGLLRQPGHGSRTASIVIGSKLKEDKFGCDGNCGLLTENDQALAKFAAYRVSKSVVLIGRGKHVVDAIDYAIQSGTDVMFMCMGSYPRPMLDAVARRAYENGVIWVCAAGNEVEVVVAPAMYPGTIAVAATNPNDQPWRGSSNGPAVDIAAPGESVYVPDADRDGHEIMSYGNGTSYATPHVAAAAMLWKAAHLQDLSKKYSYPWQVVEAFRCCLRKTARKDMEWPKERYKKYGAGVLHIADLLKEPLPDAQELKHAYAGKPWPKPSDLGIAEAVHYTWNALLRKLRPGPEESYVAAGLTNRGLMALEAFATDGAGKALESTASVPSTATARNLLHHYFEQY